MLAAKGWVVPSLRCKCEVARNAVDCTKAAQIGIGSSNVAMGLEEGALASRLLAKRICLKSIIVEGVIRCS